MLEQRQLLSVSPLTAASSIEEQLTAYTSSNSSVTTAPTVYGPLPWAFSGGSVVRVLTRANGQYIEAGNDNGNFALAQINPNGTPDSSFGGGDGKATTDFGTPSDRLLNADLRPDGKILEFGLSNASGVYQVVLSRANADGTLDTTFGTNGKLFTGIGRDPGFGVVMSVLTNGLIHVTGDAINGSGVKGYEYDANGHNAVDRLAKLKGTVKPAALSSATPMAPAASYTIFTSISASADVMGPFPDVTGAVYPQDVGVKGGQSYVIALPAGSNRVIDWGDGNTLSLADSATSTFATHTYTAGTYTPTATGLWSNLGGQMNFNPAAGTGTQYVIRADDANLISRDVVDTDNHDLVVQNPNSTTDFTSVRQSVLDGYSASQDYGKTGIVSTAGQSPNSNTILALFDNSLVGESDWPPDSSATVNSNAIIGKYTYFGDTNLDGEVTVDDDFAVDANLGTTPPPGNAILDGDTNFDGQVTSDDFFFIDANLGKGTSAPLSANPADAPLTLDTVVVSGTTGSTPEQPANVAATPSPAGDEADVNVSWDGQNNLTGYTVQRSTDASFSTYDSYQVDGATTTYSDSDLAGITPGTTLYYRVQAVSGGESSDWSATANAAAPALLPAAPDSLFAVAVRGGAGQPDKVQLTWGESSGDISDYQIQRDTSPDFSDPTTLPPVSPSDMATPVNMGWHTGDDPNQQFQPQATSISLAGNLQFSNFSSDDLVVVIGSGEQVASVHNLSGSPADHTITLPDDAILFRNTGNPWATWDGGTVELQSQTTGEAFDIDPAVDPSYYRPGAAVEDFQNGMPPSDPGFASRDYTQGITDAEMRSRGWIGTDGLAHVKVVWVGDNGGCSGSVSGSLSNYLDAPPSNGTYYYRVTATNAEGDSQMASNVATLSTPSEPPAPPTTVLYDAFSNGSYGIQWGSLGDSATGFSVWRSTSSDFTTGNVKLYTATRGDSSYTDTTAVPGTSYYYRVVPINPYSNETSDLAGASNATEINNEIYFLGADGGIYNAGTATPAELTFPYGSAIHVFLNASEIANYGSLTTRFSWTFDADTNDPYRQTEGFNAAHIYDDPDGGTETIQLTIGEPTSSGFSYETYQMPVTISPESDLTNKILVSNNGEAGTMTLQAAMNQLNVWTVNQTNVVYNVEILFEAGQTYTFVGSTTDPHGALNLKHLQNVLVGSYGIGAAPTLYYTKTQNFPAFFRDDAYSQNVTVRDLHFISDATPTAGENAAPLVIDLTVKCNLAVVDCQWGNITGEQGPTSTLGILFQGNTAAGGSNDEADRLRGYMLDLQGGTYVVAQGNTDGGSEYESDMRFENQTEFVQVFGNDLEFQDTGLKSGLRLESHDFGYAEYNLLNAPSNWFGPLNLQSNGVQNSSNLVFDSNVVYGFEDSSGHTRKQSNGDDIDPGVLDIEPGLTIAVIRNNIFWGSASMPTDAASWAPESHVVDDLWIVNNTFLSPLQTHLLLMISSSTYVRLKNIHIANNLVARRTDSTLDVTGMTDGVSLTIPSSGTYRLELEGQLGDTPESQWWDADNVWLPNQNFLVDGTSSSTDGTIYSPSGWNNIFDNSDVASDLADYHGYIRVDTNYAPTESKSAIGSRSIVGSPDMQVAAWDYYGNERPTPEVQVGAVEDYVPGERTPPPAPDYPY